MMFYLIIPRLQPVYGQLIKSYKSKLCSFSENVKFKAIFNRPKSNLVSQTTKTETMNPKISQEKDKLLYYYENPRYFILMNGFAFIQFFFWVQMAEFTANRAEKIKLETNEYSPWWKKLNFEDKKTRIMVSTFLFLIGYGGLTVAWMYTLRSVRMLVLRKDNKTLSIVTYGPFNRNRVADFPLENVSADISRNFAKSQLPIKVKGKWFYYILDMKDGKFHNPELFDRTAGMKRNLKCPLRFNGSSDYEKETYDSLSTFTSLIHSYKSLCIVTGNQEFLDIFLRYNKRQRVLTFLELKQTPVYSCESVVMLDVSHKLCKTIVNNDSKCTFYLLYSTNRGMNLPSLEKCLQNSSSSEVVVMSLKKKSLYKLSQIFPIPRFLSESNVEEVTGCRSNKNNIDDFQGITITGAFIQNYIPYFFSKNDTNKPDQYDGLEAVIFLELSQKLNFTLKFLLYYSWGNQSSNGTWLDGVGWAIHEGLAQVAVCGMWQTFTFNPIVDFGPSMAEVESIFLVRRPEQITFEWKDVLRVFTIFVWICVLFSFVSVTMVYWFSIIIIDPAYRNDWSISPLTVLGHFTMSMFHTFGTHLSARLVLTAWSVFSLLLTTVLATGVVSRLTIPSFSPRVDTMQQLVEGGFYWTAPFYVEFKDDHLKSDMFNFEDDWHKLFEKRYKYMPPDDVTAILYSDVKVTFSSQVNMDFVVLDTEGIEGQVGLRKFRVGRDETIRKRHISFGVKKHSSLLEPLSKMTLKFIEAGLVEKWRLDVFHRWPQHDTRHLLIETDISTFTEPEVFYLAKLKPIFYLLLAGLIFSTSVFCVEVFWFYL